MDIHMSFSEYLQRMNDFANDELSLAALLKPFGIAASPIVWDDLLIGFVLDDLMNEFKLEEPIDAVDVALCAYDLGCDAAKGFLESAILS